MWLGSESQQGRTSRHQSLLKRDALGLLFDGGDPLLRSHCPVVAEADISPNGAGSRFVAGQFCCVAQRGSHLAMW